MIRIEYNLDEDTVVEGGPEFEKRITNLVKEFEKSNEYFKVQYPEKKLPKHAMGEPFSLAFLLTLLVKYKAEIEATAALIALIIKIRDLYHSFRSKQKEKDREALNIEISGKFLKLPATDKEIRQFINQNSVEDQE